MPAAIRWTAVFRASSSCSRFTYSLTEIGRYYADYVDLMDHWDRVLPGKVLRVKHEDVLDDLEGQTRRMLGYLELPFEEAGLDFHKSERAVRSASSEQVRQPINRSGKMPGSRSSLGSIR